MLRWIDKFFMVVKSLNKGILIFFYGVIIIVCFVAVIFRYVFNDSLTWADELARYLFIAMVFLGGAYVVPENGHLRMDVIYTSVPRKVRKGIDVITMVCAVFFMVYALKGIWKGIAMIGTQRWSSLPLPMRLAYLPMLIGIGLSLAYLIEMVVKKIRGSRALRKTRDGKVDRHEVTSL